MVQAIQQQRPDVRITWIIGKIESQLLQGLENIEFIVFDKKGGKAAIQALKASMQGRHFDVLLMMQVALRANWVSRVIPAQIRLGFDSARSKELHAWFTTHTIAPQEHAHVLDGFMGFAAALGITIEPPQWNMPLAKEDLTFADQAAAEWGDYVVICPAASKAERCWLPERYAQIGDELSHAGKRVVLCGSPANLDVSLAQAIEQKTNCDVVNMVGKTTLKQLLALLANAQLVIAPDTGPAHMATTMGTAVIGLYAHSNPRRTGPYNNLNQVVSVYDSVILQQTGKHWQNLVWGKRAKGASLMGLIGVDEVLAQAKALLAIQ
ncbi:glycosyltransferase family 9 protein [Alteromonas flava]|uniref:glycosyltransferase family 9 protein n=1 Tax=Alteromonas flava TaxID=2048003 RepID=UPI001F0C88B3|nr:glycosyltransferase family 9 protein [Alteromonas flava]